MHIKLQSEPLTLAHGVVHKVIPLFGCVIDRTFVHDTDVEGLDATYTGSGHRLEIGSDSFLGSITVHPMPPCPRLRRRRGIQKIRLERGLG